MEIELRSLEIHIEKSMLEAFFRSTNAQNPNVFNKSYEFLFYRIQKQNSLAWIEYIKRFDWILFTACSFIAELFDDFILSYSNTNGIGRMNLRFHILPIC